MRKLLVVSLLLLSANVASADPYRQIYGDPYARRLPPPPPGYQYRPAPPPQMGGGFIEFLFGGNPNYRPQGLPRDHYVRPQYDRSRDPDAYRHYARGEPSYRRDMHSQRSIDPRYLPQRVAYDTDEKPGTIVIDTRTRHLYFVEEGGLATRYGVGVGRDGFGWKGTQTVSAKKEWPDWRPPEDMLRRQPELPRFMPGGPENPLGARALYLGSTLYRIHGSNEPHTIGQAVSSGCFRMRNEDVIELYERVGVGTKVVVL